MKRLLPFITALVIILSSCVKHTEITYPSLIDTIWMAYEVNNKELSEDEQFMFNFNKNQSLQILYRNPNNNRFEPYYSFNYSEFKDDDSAIISGYFLTSKECKEAFMHYKALDSENKKMEFKLRLFPDSDYIIIKMNKLEKVTN